MSTPREPEKTPMEKIGVRVRQRALTGGEASAVGFTLVVYIFAGAGLGYLLDTYFETSYWIAIGTLLGAAVGFREMFRLTNKLTRESAQIQETENAARDAVAVKEISQPVVARDDSVKTVPEEPTHTKPRIFAVPPPPAASFDTRASTREAAVEPLESQEELIERLSQSETEDSEGAAK